MLVIFPTYTDVDRGCLIINVRAASTSSKLTAHVSTLLPNCLHPSASHGPSCCRRLGRGTLARTHVDEPLQSVKRHQCLPDIAVRTGACQPLMEDS